MNKSNNIQLLIEGSEELKNFKEINESRKIYETQRKIRKLVSVKPLYWLTNFVRTHDPDSLNPDRPFPDQPHIRALTRYWLSERVLFVAKSSQQMATWLFVALHLWDAMYHPGKFVLFQSSKESKSGFSGGDSKEQQIKGNPLTLLGRADIIYNKLPKFLQTPRLISKSPPTMKFLHIIKGVEVPSIILATSSSSEEARQWTITNALMDEAAFLPDFDENIRAILPRLTSRARLTVISTPNGKDGFYARIYDKTI